MDWSKFPPSNLALMKVYTFLGVAFTSVGTVQYGVSTYHHQNASTTSTHLSISNKAAAVLFKSDSEPCPTCVSSTEDRLLGSYGQPLSLDQLLDNASHPTHIISSSMAQATDVPAVSIPNSTSQPITRPTPGALPVSRPRSETPLSPPPTTPFSEALLGWLVLLYSWWFFPMENVAAYFLEAPTSDGVLPRLQSIGWLIFWRLAARILSEIATVSFRRLCNIWKNRRAKASSLTTKDQPATPEVEDPRAALSEWKQHTATYMDSTEATMRLKD